MKKPIKKKREPAPELVKTSLLAVAEAYIFDSTSPGIVLSYLKKEKLYYASICRYRGDKIVIASAKAGTWQGALKAAMLNFVDNAAIMMNLKKVLE